MDFSVSVIIPNFNGRVLLERNLPALVKASHNPKNRIKEIIVVDDGSTDDSVSFLKKNYPLVRVIRQRINRGFSHTVNLGVGFSKGSLVCLINNDVRVTENFLVSTIKLFENPKVFAVSLHEKGFSFARGRFEDGFIVHEPAKEGEVVSETFWVSGGSGVFRKDYWKKLKGFDAGLLSPFYWEDVDLCYRALKRGFLLLWNPKALVFHMHESTISKLDKRYVNLIKERNHLLFIWKNLTSPQLFRKHIKGLIKRIILHPGYIKVVFFSLLKIREVLKKRKIEKKQSNVSDEAIFGRFAKMSSS